MKTKYMKFLRMLMFATVFLLSALVSFSVEAVAQKNKEDKKAINWISFETLEQQMKENPKRVIVDVYTNWCKWCKVMDKKVYGNKGVIDYINENYYAVKFNAEMKEDIIFGGRTFHFKSEIGMHELASEIMLGSRSFPTTVIMEPSFLNVSPFGGYIELKEFEKLIKFFHEAYDKGQSWDAFEKSFKNEW